MLPRSWHPAFPGSVSLEPKNPPHNQPYSPVRTEPPGSHLKTCQPSAFSLAPTSLPMGWGRSGLGRHGNRSRLARLLNKRKRAIRFLLLLPPTPPTPPLFSRHFLLSSRRLKDFFLFPSPAVLWCPVVRKVLGINLKLSSFPKDRDLLQKLSRSFWEGFHSFKLSPRWLRYFPTPCPYIFF